MHNTQHTLQGSLNFTGTGAHKGQPVEVHIEPAAAGHGLVFQRTDHPENPCIPALVANVLSADAGIVLAKKGIELCSVGPILGALYGMQVDNALIKINGPEVPAMDGSAQDFVAGIKKVGLVDQKEARNYFELPKSMRYANEDQTAEILAYPTKDCRLRTLIESTKTEDLNQHACLDDLAGFAENIAPARAFYFLEEYHALGKQSLAKGLSLENSLMLAHGRESDSITEGTAKALGLEVKALRPQHKELLVANQSWRMHHEAASHSLLNLMGVLALLGKPFKGQIISLNANPSVYIDFVRHIAADTKKRYTLDKNLPLYDPEKPFVLDITKIMDILPHQHPFLLLDGVFYQDDWMIGGVKNVTYNEPFFRGHFPDRPIMPGVLQIEVMAQLGAIFLQSTVSDPENYWTYFLGIDGLRFRQLVTPGDTLVCYARLLQAIRHHVANMETKIYVGNKLICGGILRARKVHKEEL